MNVSATLPSEGCFRLSFSILEEGEVGVLKEHNLVFVARMDIWESWSSESNSREYTTTFALGSDDQICFFGAFRQDINYFLKVRVEGDGVSSQWSDVFGLTSQQGAMFCQQQSIGFMPQQFYGSGFMPGFTPGFTPQGMMPGFMPGFIPQGMMPGFTPGFAPQGLTPGSTPNTPNFIINIPEPINDGSGTTPPVKADYSFKWKELPRDIEYYTNCTIDESMKIVKMTGDCDECLFRYCTIVGDKRLPSDGVARWNIKLLSFADRYGRCDINIGVAPSDIDQSYGDNSIMCGWYFHCHGSKLRSGFPHKYKGKEYGTLKGHSGKVSEEDVIGVVMDMPKRALVLCQWDGPWRCL